MRYSFCYSNPAVCGTTTNDVSTSYQYIGAGGFTYGNYSPCVYNLVTSATYYTSYSQVEVNILFYQGCTVYIVSGAS